jgi:hypothetical protein
MKRKRQGRKTSCRKRTRNITKVHHPYSASLKAVGRIYSLMLVRYYPKFNIPITKTTRSKIFRSCMGAIKKGAIYAIRQFVTF